MPKLTPAENLLLAFINPDLYRIDVTEEGKHYQDEQRRKLMNKAINLLGMDRPEPKPLFKGRTDLLKPNRSGRPRKEDL